MILRLYIIYVCVHSSIAESTKFSIMILNLVQYYSILNLVLVRPAVLQLYENKRERMVDPSLRPRSFVS
jgi:hypothetical protein